MLAGSLTVAMAIVPLAGYLAGIDEAYNWRKSIGMAVHTVVCLLLPGSGILAYLWHESSGVPRRLPVSAFITLTASTLAIAEAVRIAENTIFERNVKREAEFIANQAESRLAEVFNAVDRFSLRWTVAGGTPQAVWEADANAYIKNYPFVTALEWVDRDSYLQWAVPLNENQTLFGINLNTEGTRGEAVQSALATHESQITQALPLLQGGKGFLYISPLFVQNRYDGLIAAVFRIDGLLKNIAVPGEAPDFYLTLRENNEAIFSNVPAGSTELEEWQQTATVKVVIRPVEVRTLLRQV